MKQVAISMLFLVQFYLHATAAPEDTLIHFVNVEFATPGGTAFPAEWKEAPANANSVPLSTREFNRSRYIVIAALRKYPLSILRTNLKAVYFFKHLNFFDVGYAGTNSNDALYLANDGIDLGYTSIYIEQTFHHEFSSILFRNYPSYLDTTAWKNSNATGFDYNDPEGGVGAIRNNQSSQKPDTILCIKGFLTQYAYSSIENDVNTIAQNLFKPSPGFWKIVDTYPRISKKVKLLIAFYSRINAIFTESYFRQFGKINSYAYSAKKPRQ